MWLPLRVHLMPTYLISQLGSEVSGISSSKIFVDTHWGSLTGCIQPQKHLIQKYKMDNDNTGGGGGKMKEKPNEVRDIFLQ